MCIFTVVLVPVKVMSQMGHWTILNISLFNLEIRSESDSELFISKFEFCEIRSSEFGSEFVIKSDSEIEIGFFSSEYECLSL